LRPNLGAPEPEAIQGPAGYGFPNDPDRLLPWSHAHDRLEEARYYWLTTSRADGRPHATPLWGAWIDQALFLDGSPTTRWARNIAANPSACIHLESGSNAVILEGVVDEVVTEEMLGARIVDGWMRKYGRLEPKPAVSGMFRFRPHTARAWSTETLEDGTRWRFADR
jgi:hypothetical protein